MTVSWSLSMGCGLQTTTPSCTWPLNGRSFNPPDNYPTNTWANVWGATSTFDLTNFWVGNEVALAFIGIYVSPGDSYAGYAEWCWFRGASNYGFYDRYFNIDGGASGFCAWGFAYTGVKPFCDAEICCNGQYCVKTCLEDIGYSTACFCICCLQSCRLCKYPASAAGSIWVQDTCLGYTPVGCSNWPGYPCTWRSIILNDGLTHGGAGINKAGSIWVESGGGCRLYWVDCNGCIRRSKQGDSLGYHCYDAMPCNAGAGKAGYIWAQSGFQDDAIFFIDSTGQKIRIGVGYLYGDCY